MEIDEDGRERLRSGEYGPEIKAIEAEGFKLLAYYIRDWGRTKQILIKRGNEPERVLSLVKVYYDTDKDGEITTVHGSIDIRETLWSKKKARR